MTDYKTQQLNVKLTDAEWKELESLNKDFFHGKLNKTDLGRYLLSTALGALKDGTVGAPVPAYKPSALEVLSNSVETGFPPNENDIVEAILELDAKVALLSIKGSK